MEILCVCMCFPPLRGPDIVSATLNCCLIWFFFSYWNNGNLSEVQIEQLSWSAWPYMTLHDLKISLPKVLEVCNFWMSYTQRLLYFSSMFTFSASDSVFIYYSKKSFWIHPTSTMLRGWFLKTDVLVCILETCCQFHVFCRPWAF